MSTTPPENVPGQPGTEPARGTPRRHHHSTDRRGAGKRSLALALVLIVAYMFVEVAGGVLSGSLALIADAGHMLTDAASIALALAAMHFATRAATTRRTFGYHRLEILAALFSGLTLVAISIWVIAEAYHRFQDPPTVQGGLVLGVGSIGLLVNVAAAWILHGSARHSVNVEGALAHVMADLLGSVAVVVSGVLVWAFGWHLADPVLSALIGVLILISSWRLLARVVHILLEGTPDHIDIEVLCTRMGEVDGVADVHDVHCWILAPGYEAFTAHVTVVAPEDPARQIDHQAVLDHLRRIVYDEFKLNHVTLQLEKTAGRCNEEHHVDNLAAASRTRAHD